MRLQLRSHHRQQQQLTSIVIILLLAFPAAVKSALFSSTSSFIHHHNHNRRGKNTFKNSNNNIRIGRFIDYHRLNKLDLVLYSSSDKENFESMNPYKKSPTNPYIRKGSPNNPYKENDDTPNSKSSINPDKMFNSPSSINPTGKSPFNPYKIFSFRSPNNPNEGNKSPNNPNSNFISPNNSYKATNEATKNFQSPNSARSVFNDNSPDDFNTNDKVSKKRSFEEGFNSLNCTMNKYFGFETFRPGQEEVIRAILYEKRDAAVFWATGQGKSLCFQIPALHSKKTAVVISPLISLMQDQCAKLNALYYS